mmetsp:Transcript_21590/g.44397  ORF Transcript_21590/g.44397 Transcript_21590/m.44397 type:complete len:104 (+) Transcript_21590:807-1118(+)
MREGITIKGIGIQDQTMTEWTMIEDESGKGNEADEKEIMKTMIETVTEAGIVTETGIEIETGIETITNEGVRVKGTVTMTTSARGDQLIPILLPEVIPRHPPG